MQSQEENPLEVYFYNNRKNIIHKWTHYFEIYHRYFQKYIGKECVVLEVGVSQGGSLQMWKHYFGAHAKIYGIDIMPECKRFEEDQIEIIIGSQSDREFLRGVKAKIPKIDILIDDGGHTMEQQITTFEEFFDHIADDGIYLCEDTHTSYWGDFGGGYQKPETFIEFTKRLIDQLNAWHIYNHKNLITDFTKTAQSIHFYDSIVVIEKSPRKPLMVLQIDDVSAFANQIATESDLFLFELKLKLLDAEIPLGYDPVVFLHNNDFLKNLLKEKFSGTDWPQNAETMIGYKRLTNLEFCVRETIQNGIPGDLIETGVWRGGACIYMRALLKTYEVNNKTVWVADSFEGLPMPSPDLFPIDEGDKHYTFSELAVPIEEVKSNFIKYGLLDDQVMFLKGWFKDTLPKAPIQNLSVLRLDGDMYESTIDALFYLYPKLSIGGYCIIDDWGAVPACKKAVEDYRNIFAIQEVIEEVDWTGVFWKKEIEISCLSRTEFMEKLKLMCNGEI